MCVSYQKLNQSTRPFTFPIPLCDDSVHYIDIEANYFIAVDMYSGYWEIVAEEEACKRLELFTPDGKWRCKLIPMGYLSAATTFVAMMTKLQME